MIQTIQCKCGETKITHDGLCFKCKQIRQKPICEFCDAEHWPTEMCDIIKLKEKINELLCKKYEIGYQEGINAACIRNIF